MAEFLDRIPIVSQVKHITHKAIGDSEGAERNAANYIYSNPGVSHVVAAVTKVAGDEETAEKCLQGGNSALNAIPVVGQLKALVHLAIGDGEKADEALKSSNQVLGSMLDATPIIGHVKGAIHLATGDEERAKASIEEANRTSVVVAAGSAGLVAAGPAGAVGAGIAAGISMDAISSSEKPEVKPAPLKFLEDPRDLNAWCDVGVKLAADALAGFGGGHLVKKVTTVSESVPRAAIQVNKSEPITQRFPSIAKKSAKEGSPVEGDLLQKAIKDISAEADKIADHLPRPPDDGFSPTSFSTDTGALRSHEKVVHQNQLNTISSEHESQ